MRTILALLTVLVLGATLLGGADDIYSAPPNAPRASLVAAVPTSPTNVCVDSGSTAHDCWFAWLCVNNTTNAAITFSATNASGTPIDLTTSASMAANTSSCQVWPGGNYFQGGLKLTAGATGLTVRGRYARALN